MRWRGVARGEPPICSKRGMEVIPRDEAKPISNVITSIPQPPSSQMSSWHEMWAWLRALARFAKPHRCLADAACRPSCACTQVHMDTCSCVCTCMCRMAKPLCACGCICMCRHMGVWVCACECVHVKGR